MTTPEDLASKLVPEPVTASVVVEPLVDADADVETETELVALEEELGLAADAKTNFPTKGDNKKVSLSGSQWRTFPVAYAEDLKANWPEIWGKGGNIRGNSQYAKLLPVAKRGGSVTSKTEENAVRLREAWVARHKGDFQLAGVIAQIKWLAVGERGVDHMKSVVNEAKTRIRERRAQLEVPMDTELLAQLEARNLELSTELDAIKVEFQALKSATCGTEGCPGLFVCNGGCKTATVVQPVADSTVVADPRVAELESKLDELTTTREALASELAAAVEAQAALVTELEGYRAAKAAEAEAEAARVAEERLAARIAELPEPYRAAHAKREESVRTRLEANWAALSEEDWELKKEELSGGFVAIATALPFSFVARSQETVLPAVAEPTGLKAKIASHIVNK
jgi:hypothetical protein